MRWYKWANKRLLSSDCGLCLRPCCSVQELLEVLPGVLVAGEQVERVTVNLDVAADWHVRRRDERHRVVYVFVLSALQEFALDDAGVLLCGLVDRDAIVTQVERYDEATVKVFWNSRVQFGGVPEHFFVVVYALEEVTLWLFRDQLVDITERVHLVTEAVVRWNYNWGLLWDSGVLDLADGEVVPVFFCVKVLSKLVYSRDLIFAAESTDGTTWVDLVTSQVVVANEVLAWLIHVEAVWQFLTTEEARGGFAAIVGAVRLIDFNCVIGQVIVNDVRQVLTEGEEAEHLTIVVQELLLGSNLTTT